MPRLSERRPEATNRVICHPSFGALLLGRRIINRLEWAQSVWRSSFLFAGCCLLVGVLRLALGRNVLQVSCCVVLCCSDEFGFGFGFGCDLASLNQDANPNLNLNPNLNPNLNSSSSSSLSRSSNPNPNPNPNPIRANKSSRRAHNNKRKISTPLIDCVSIAHLRQLATLNNCHQTQAPNLTDRSVEPLRATSSHLELARTHSKPRVSSVCVCDFGATRVEFYLLCLRLQSRPWTQFSPSDPSSVFAALNAISALLYSALT